MKIRKYRENVTMIDIRPLPFEVKGLTFLQSDATNLNEIKNDTIESISSLHAIGKRSIVGI